jgi:hypothetical protein
VWISNRNGHLVQIFDSVSVIWSLFNTLRNIFQHTQVIIFPENLSQNKAEEENEKKTKDLLKISSSVDSFVGVWANFLLIKLKIHTIPKNLRQN